MIVKENLDVEVKNADKVHLILKSILDSESEIDQEKEHFWVIGLNGRNRIKYIDLISLGILDRSLVHPRETFRLAVLKGVAAIVIAHNHPSGDIDPSDEDITITHRLQDAGHILRIEILDHLIISGDQYFSFQEKGLIWRDKQAGKGQKIK